MKILNIILLVCIFDLIPALLISGLIRFIFKKKISKGWCVLVFIISALTTYLLNLLILGISQGLGVLDYIVHFVVIKQVLYDNKIPSILDNEKELKEKQE